MSRTLVLVAASSLLASILTWSVLSQAQAQQPVLDVQCTQLPQMQGMVDQAFVERFMSTQIAAGRKHFESVQGISTLLCAW